jgi:hypothetical protein
MDKSLPITLRALKKIVKEADEMLGGKPSGTVILKHGIPEDNPTEEYFAYGVKESYYKVMYYPGNSHFRVVRDTFYESERPYHVIDTI